MAKSWKDALLASGLPLEHDVKRFLEKRGCIARYEYSYLKPDEQRRERQFSYDVDASYIRPPHFANLMVECKYRHPSVKWVFTPEDYGGPDEFYENAFLHPMDHFVARRFSFVDAFPRRLAPCCSKGVEILPDGANDKAVTQALSQLAFGFAPQLVSAIEHQVLDYLPGDMIFHHIPLIITTAELLRLRDDVTLGAIRHASDVADVATREELVVLKYTAGAELKEYNRESLDAMQARLGDKALQPRLKTFTADLRFLFSVLAERSPEAVVVISVADGWSGCDRFFQYVDELFAPSAALLAEVRDQQTAREERAKALEKVMKTRAAEKK